MTRNEGLQGSASIAEAIEQRPQPALEPNISSGGHKHAPVFTPTHFRDFRLLYKINFRIIFEMCLWIMIFSFKIWVLAQRAAFKREKKPLTGQISDFRQVADIFYRIGQRAGSRRALKSESPAV